MALISARGVTVAQRLRGIDFELEQGQMVGLIGPNGAGKSTLLQVLAGLLDCEGEVSLNGESMFDLPVRERARRLVLQPQFIDSSWSLSVEDVVSFGRIPWGDMDREIIRAAMREAGVEVLAARRIDELSGGEKARVWLARVLANQAEILLMDEIVANLDIHYQHAVLDILKTHTGQGRAVVVALHDLSLAAKFCDSLYLLDAGRVVESGPVQAVLNAELLSRVYCADIHVDLGASPPVVLGR